jgi:hypothetical protein
MRGNIISYIEMCRQEGISLQKGMNFKLRGKHSVLLMSVRPNSPYEDKIEEDGTVLIYEGHDAPKTKKSIEPKLLDQPEFSNNGLLTENGKFHKAAQQFKLSLQRPEIVRVYEKIRGGIWSDNGFFHLVDSWLENDGKRNVFKFRLVALDDSKDILLANNSCNQLEGRSRIIPTSVKLEVWARDRGRCVTCGATDELHFDHIVPFSKGGTSLKPENIQLLCARHNLEKRDKIQ